MEPEVTPDQLQAAFDVLTALLACYNSRSREWAAVCEARRLVESQMPTNDSTNALLRLA